ncbi:prepilin-type N-terminal cleavage/methylation domain-containing protein [Zobellella sp. DQSA1]|uniref:type IV pilus modification PilV family protein n=1 Tax=Zobellella sp. DQSA1 TaxID=3342386 RepID=UPI0035C1FF3E
MKKQAGFGLVEVVIAFILVAVTAGSLLQLHKVYLEYSRDGRYREVALRLAESKLDELRGFGRIADYQAIASSSAPESVRVDDTDYAIEWGVIDYVWDGGAWVTPLPSGVASGKKAIDITVGWSQPDGGGSLRLESVLSPHLSIGSGPFGTGSDKMGLGMGGPDVRHAPGTFPAVIPVDLGGGLKQETSQPLPKMARPGSSESTRVSFSTLVYDGANITQQEQELVSVSCACTITSSDNASLPAQRSVSGGIAYWLQGGSASKIRGTPANHQDPLCGRCCAHHFDGSAHEFGNWYDLMKWQAGHGPHGHSSGVPGNWIPVTAVGDPYWEACRLVRINGFYEMANDWNLVALNTFDANLLLEPEVQAAYRDYVKMVVQEYIRSQLKDGSRLNTASYYAPPAFSSYLLTGNVSPGTTDIGIIPGPRQLMARGIYVDMVSPDYRDILLNGVMEGNADASPENLLRYAPFYEVDLTLLADWRSTDSTVASVTSEPVQTAVDSSQNNYGVYSRGLLDGKQLGGPVTITATIRRSNSGITAFRPLSAFEESDILSSSLEVEVLSTGGLSSVSGQVKCLAYRVTGQVVQEEKCSGSQFANISVLLNNQGCAKTTVGQGSNQTINYVCYTAPGATANITASVPAGYVVIPPAPATSNPWHVTVPEGDPSSISGGCLLVVVNKPDAVAMPASCQPQS